MACLVAIRAKPDDYDLNTAIKNSQATYEQETATRPIVPAIDEDEEMAATSLGKRAGEGLSPVKKHRDTSDESHSSRSRKRTSGVPVARTADEVSPVHGQAADLPTAARPNSEDALTSAGGTGSSSGKL
jgi:hypothetical protein